MNHCIYCGEDLTPYHHRDTGSTSILPAGYCPVLFERRNMNTTTLTDDFGRKTIFTGVRLVDETTDTEEGDKPQWLEVAVWRTEGGNFVVRRTTFYRVVHTSENCSRADGYVLVPATAQDTYPCKSCNPHGSTVGFAQAPRISVEVYSTPSELTESFRASDGRYSNFSRAILSDLAKLDPGIDGVWSVVHVA